MADIEEWIKPGEDLEEVEVDADVFYDFFLSVPIVKTKRKYNDLVDEYLKKIKDPANNDDRVKQEDELVHLYQVQKQMHRDQLQSILDRWAKIHPDGTIPHPKAVEYQYKINQVKLVLEDKAELRRRALACKKHYENYEEATDQIATIERRLHNMNKNDPGYADEEARMKKFKKEAKKYKQDATRELTEHVLSKVTLWSIFDAYVLKWAVVLLSNIVVFFMIYVIMMTISSSALPGRQQLDDVASFPVILKVDRSKGRPNHIERFTQAGEITDVCQGLAWWMHDEAIFDLTSAQMPKGDELRDLTKQHWDKYLNPDYKCPLLWDALENELWDADHGGQCSAFSQQPIAGPTQLHPESANSMWWETPSFFLFQDQVDAEEYHEDVMVVTLKATGEKKEFTVMAGNYNEKVQMLQPLNPLYASGEGAGGPDPVMHGTARNAHWTDMQTFWLAKDRIWPSEWTVQALFNLPWNGQKGWDETLVVGGYNEFGRRPSAIVKANGHEGYGYMIEEAIWQFLERSCWRNTEEMPSWTYKFPDIEYDEKSKYDKSKTGEDFITWENLDQDQRAWWRALGLGVDKSTCNPNANAKVTTNNACISGEAGCTRVNYHTAKRWEKDNNDDALAEQRFNARDFSVIFFDPECDDKVFQNGKVETVEKPLEQVLLTWDDIDAGQKDDGRFLEAATNLGYDEDEWDAHAADPTRASGPPDNLVLYVENYVEGEAYYNLFFYTQIICAIIMIAVSTVEMRNIFAMWRLTTGMKGSWVFRYLRIVAFLAAAFQYIVIPVFTIQVSLLLILESGNILDVIKDTLALLFLLEINNYLQFRNGPDASKWSVKIKGDHAKQLERTKNFFCILLLAVFFVGAWAASLTFGWSSNFHPSLWLNPFLDPKDFDTGNAVGMTVFLHLLVVLCMVLAPCLVWLADIIRKKLDLAYDTTWVQNFVDKIVATTVPADEIDGEFDEDLEKYSWDAQETPVTPMPPPTGQEPRNLLGTWTLEMSPNGPMEVLVAFDGRRLARRLPGDTSGQSTVWLTEQPASPGVILSMPAAPAAANRPETMSSNLTYAQPQTRSYY